MLALMLALMVAVTCLGAALAEDWRSLLRDMSDVSEEDEQAALEDEQATRENDSEDNKTPEFELPVTDPQQIVNYLAFYGELPDNL